MVALEFIFGGESLQERHACGQLGDAGQARAQFAVGHVVHHVRTDQQIDRGAGSQPGEIAEAGQVQVAGPAVAAHSVLAAVETEVVDLRTQFQQRRAPGAFAAADVQHAADRSFQVVLGRGHGEGDLARQARAATDVGAAVPALEVGGVVGLVHGVRVQS
ncbi:hypothetical protein D3C73_1078480 [compost metagenome]